MSLKDHRQQLMSTLDAIRQAVPEDAHADIEPHLRDILGYDKDVRERLHNLPEQAEAARAEVSRVRVEAERETEKLQQRIVELEGQLRAGRAEQERERQKPIAEKTVDWGDAINRFVREPFDQNWQQNSQVLVVWLIHGLALHATHIAMRFPEAASRPRQAHTGLRQQLFGVINAHMERVGAGFRLKMPPVNAD